MTKLSANNNQLSPLLILASGSPRRAELLRQIGLDFTQLTVAIDESRQPNENIADYALRMAQEKAESAWRHCQTMLAFSARPYVILSADTCGEIDGKLLSKPTDFADGKRLLNLLSGRTHTIYSAFALYNGVKMSVENVTSQVTFSRLSDSQIERYWATGEPCDKAGAYAIQGIGAQFVSHLSGSYSAVMGLPLFELSQALKHFDGTWDAGIL